MTHLVLRGGRLILTGAQTVVLDAATTRAVFDLLRAGAGQRDVDGTVLVVSPTSGDDLQLELVLVTDHALDRLRGLYGPDFGERGALRKLRGSIDIDPGAVAGLLVPRLESVQDAYRLNPERTGLFVLARRRDGTGGMAVVTFIRFGATQQAMALELWPPPSAPSAEQITTSGAA